MLVSSTQAESGRQPLERQGATPRPNAPPLLDHTPRRNAAPRKAGLARRPPESSPPVAGEFSSASQERASRLPAETSWSRAAARSPAAGLLLTLLGPLCVLAPVLLLPVAAEAQTTVWSGTLTVRNISGLLGCTNGFTGNYCSDHLSDDDFTHDGTDYAIFTLWVRTNGNLELVFDTDLTTATQALTLNLDGTAFAFEDADSKGDDFRTWYSSGLSWTVGATVSATLTAAGTTTDTTAPAFESAAANGASLVITFDEDLAAAASLANSAFTVKKTASGGSEATVALSTTVAPVISGTTVTLTLGTALVSTDGSVKVTYTKPTTGSANKLVDAAGNETATFTDQTVTNNTPAANNAPVFNPTAVSRSVAENTAAGQNVGAAVTATDADTGDTLTYTLGGADAASFDIVSTSGQIQTKTGVTYDHEAKASYAVTVTASDSTDTADATVTISVTDVDEPPAAPAAPTVTATTGSTTSLDVTWTAPTNTGKPAIDNYDLQYRQGNSGNFTAGPQDQTGLTASIGSLTAGTSYQVQVRAHNAEGDGDWSASGTGSTSSPTNNAPVFNPTAVSRSVAENTAAGENVGAAVTATDADTGDTLTYTLGGTDAASFDIVSTSGQIQTKTGVTYDHEAKASYAVTVTASDGTATADATVTISVTDVNEPPTAPAAPAVAGISGSTTSLTVSWTAPTNTGKPAITSYDVQYRQGTTGAFTNGPQDATGTSATITGLMASTLYQVQVRATNAEGDSAWSASGSGTTGTTATAPVAPAAPTVAAVTGSSTSLAVSWIAPADGGSAITTYDVQFRPGTSGDFDHLV